MEPLTVILRNTGRLDEFQARMLGREEMLAEIWQREREEGGRRSSLGKRAASAEKDHEPVQQTVWVLPPLADHTGPEPLHSGQRVRAISLIRQCVGQPGPRDHSTLAKERPSQGWGWSPLLATKPTPG